ncbi:juxtaposed with another zinc finger protein 1 [Chelonus insularis]|uniref:juxtaposed with another zinc finger protein 1 n=1 Tax=Chelonus insularis TaxID=460826 RepID=UPI00158D15C7|nr:juxtaposed with another zinc finger protein 1 [Chelonus insularis]
MAVFMLNVCKFNACGLTFKSLGHLIQHIEETHIDYDPLVIEQSEQQQPPCIPLSYALRFLTDAARQEAVKHVKTTLNLSPSRNKNSTPPGSEVEEEDDLSSEPEDSNDSWTTSEEFSADYILRYGSRVVNQTITTQNNHTNKPFACPVPGCKKRYKNVNGIKYHSKNGHKNDGKIHKAFKCSCGKSYKTTYGLKNHAAIQHSSGTGSIIKSMLIKSSKTGNENENITILDNLSSKNSKNPLNKISKSKISAIEDHGYIKSERSILTETELECDNDLGVLTPASTPPLAVHNLPKSEQPIIHQVRTLHKYFSNTSCVTSNRRHVKNEY